METKTGIIIWRKEDLSAIEVYQLERQLFDMQSVLYNYKRDNLPENKVRLSSVKKYDADELMTMANAMKQAEVDRKAKQDMYNSLKEIVDKNEALLEEYVIEQSGIKDYVKDEKQLKNILDFADAYQNDQTLTARLDFLESFVHYIYQK